MADDMATHYHMMEELGSEFPQCLLQSSLTDRREFWRRVQGNRESDRRGRRRQACTYHRRELTDDRL